MPDYYLLAALVGIALTIFGLGYGARMWTERARSQARAVANLERALGFQQAAIDELKKRAQPASKHDLRHLERHDIGEATLFDLAEMRETARLLTDRIEYASRRALHVANGGSPDDPPTKWQNGETK
jgi:hypothetical protein